MAVGSNTFVVAQEIVGFVYFGGEQVQSCVGQGASHSPSADMAVGDCHDRLMFRVQVLEDDLVIRAQSFTEKINNNSILLKNMFIHINSPFHCEACQELYVNNLCHL